MADLGVILGDLDAETRTIDDVVAALPADGWARPTPAEGWTIAHQIAHLAWTDRKALIAAAHPDRVRPPWLDAHGLLATAPLQRAVPLAERADGGGGLREADRA